MTTGDLRFAAELHRRFLGHGLFPALGPTFLRAYLATYLVSPFAMALVAAIGGRPVGFLVGTIDDRLHYRYVLRRRGLRLAILGAVGLLVRPRVAVWFLHTRVARYVRGLRRLTGPGGTGPAAPGVDRDAVLAHVAVSPTARARGAGSALVEEFGHYARNAGASSAQLVTRADNSGAGLFYERLGWWPTGYFVDRDGVTWMQYRIELG
jgi:ribosomal protein S18 acetylase RimI-like enzyme